MHYQRVQMALAISCWRDARDEREISMSDIRRATKLWAYLAVTRAMNRLRQLGDLGYASRQRHYIAAKHWILFTQQKYFDFLRGWSDERDLDLLSSRKATIHWGLVEKGWVMRNLRRNVKTSFKC